MKKLLPLLLSVLALTAGAQDSFINGLPEDTTPADTDVVPADTLVGANWRTRKFTLLSLRGYFGGSTSAPVQYFFSTNVYTTNLYTFTSYSTTQITTNLYANYLSAHNSEITNVTVFGDAYFYETNYANYQYTTNQYVEFSWITNLFVDYITNNYLYSTNIEVSNINVTSNITYLAATPTTNAWAGATNSLPLHVADQYYLALTPCEITGFTSKSNNVSQHVLLTVLNNNSGSNITLYLPAAVRTGDYADSYTISNNAVGVLSLNYTPALGGLTNAVFRDFN